MSKKKENREEEKEQSRFRSGLTDEQIEAALNTCKKELKENEKHSSAVDWQF